MAYRTKNTSYQPTRPTLIPNGERRRPRPEGRPGFLRIDNVHQGDRDGVKGLYHINAVDEVTQGLSFGQRQRVHQLQRGSAAGRAAHRANTRVSDGDNGLVEAKNGSVVRKHPGFGHIEAQHAETGDRWP